MALQRIGNRSTFPFDGAPAATIGQYLIAVTSLVNAGNAALASGPYNLGFIGITVEPTDPKGYAGVQQDDIAQVVAGANVTAGQQLTSNSIGQAVPISESASGGALQLVIGTALNTALSGNLVDVMLNPGSAS